MSPAVFMGSVFKSEKAHEIKTSKGKTTRKCYICEIKKEESDILIS